MSTQISSIFGGLHAQQFPALLVILEKARVFADQNPVSEEELIQSRLVEDMHPLLWQVQTVCELAARSAARLTGKELPSIEFNETTFSGLAERVKEVLTTIKDIDSVALDASSEAEFTIPIGPEATITLTGEDYVLKFFLPNLYFHLTTAYALLRKQGVDLGKRDYMGPIAA